MKSKFRAKVLQLLIQGYINASGVSYRPFYARTPKKSDRHFQIVHLSLVSHHSNIWRHGNQPFFRPSSVQLSLQFRALGIVLDRRCEDVGAGAQRTYSFLLGCKKEYSHFDGLQQSEDVSCGSAKGDTLQPMHEE